jgi:type I restriction enzyme S subunit
MLDATREAVEFVRCRIRADLNGDHQVFHVNNVVRKTDRMSESALSAIGMLREYRSALITQAVTGKIDVRNVAISETAAKGETA